MAKSKLQLSCPCGLGMDYQHCCGKYIDGTEVAPDAVALMRSRYTAYTLQHESYLQKSWHPRTRPAEVVSKQTSKQNQCKWIRLDIIAHQQKGQNATVEFIASYKISGRAEKLHETSRFVCEDGQWFYLDGVFSTE